MSSHYRNNNYNNHHFNNNRIRPKRFNSRNYIEKFKIEQTNETQIHVSRQPINETFYNQNGNAGNHQLTNYHANFHSTNLINTQPNLPMANSQVVALPQAQPPQQNVVLVPMINQMVPNSNPYYMPLYIPNCSLYPQMPPQQPNFIYFYNEPLCSQCGNQIDNENMTQKL